MSLVLTQSCECAILVAIQQGRGFLHTAEDHDISIQSKLELVLPTAVDDLIPPKTIISTRPSSVDAQGIASFQTTLAYMMSFKLLHRLRTHNAKIHLTMVALSPYKPHFSIGTISLHLSKAKVVVQRNGQRELDQVYDFVRDKGAWHSAIHGREELKAGLFIVAMPSDKHILTPYSAPFLAPPLTSSALDTATNGSAEEDIELHSLPSTESASSSSPHSNLDAPPPPLYSDTTTTSTTTTTTANTVATLLSASSAHSRSSAKKERPRSITDALVDRRRTSVIKAMKKRQMQDTKNVALPTFARVPIKPEVDDTEEERSETESHLTPPSACANPEKKHHSTMEELAVALRQMNPFHYDESSSARTPLPSAAGVNTTASAPSRRRHPPSSRPQPPPPISVPATPTFYYAKGEVLRYHQVGRGSTPYTFYFDIVHADHLLPLLKKSSSSSSSSSRRSIRKPYFVYSFLSTDIRRPAAAFVHQRRPSSEAAAATGADMSDWPTCFHLRGHLVDIQQWLDEDQRRLQLALVLHDDTSKDVIFNKETVGVAQIPLNNLAYDLSSDLRIYDDRPPSRRASVMSRLINERSFPIYDLRRRHITHSATGEIAKVTVRVGLVSGWWHGDDDDASIKSHEPEPNVTPRTELSIKRPNSRSHGTWDVYKNKKSKYGGVNASKSTAAVSAAATAATNTV